ncbi:hypothetical protein GPECTOR_13g757 [Gonium pectorale]|uniref:Uncharacterized protein n=1 Tax=Gonium pectorale TaxID=33097 RepID=A0A150GPL2_GONPE|nr:hypothetical protein GPECTOR_13g757 [Gonium pectorale]|eukprot:KXZ51270.1 hypothetical protein GPECTOR_13g757 [Gonium pectorale]
MHQRPTVFIRELEHTARCDKFFDFSSIRAAYGQTVGQDSMQRIANYGETEKDERRAAQAVVHHYDWTQRNLVKALSWESWMWYVTVYKVEHTFALGGVVGGWKFVCPWRKWTQAEQQQQQQPSPIGSWGHSSSPTGSSSSSPKQPRQ